MELQLAINKVCWLFHFPRRRKMSVLFHNLSLSLFSLFNNSYMLRSKPVHPFSHSIPSIDFLCELGIVKKLKLDKLIHAFTLCWTNSCYPWKNIFLITKFISLSLYTLPCWCSSLCSHSDTQKHVCNWQKKMMQDLSFRQTLFLFLLRVGIAA